MDSVMDLTRSATWAMENRNVTKDGVPWETTLESLIGSNDKGQQDNGKQGDETT